MAEAKQTLLQLVASGKTREALHRFLDQAPPEETGLREEIILLQAQFARWEKDVRQKTTTQEELDIRIAHINAALVQLIEKLPGGIPLQKPEIRSLEGKLWKPVSLATAALALLLLALAYLFGFLPGLTGGKNQESVDAPSNLESLNGDNLADFSCLAEDINDIPGIRVLRLEEGIREHVLLGPNADKEKPVCLVFTVNRQAAGAIVFSFFLKEEIFKIAKAVDEDCVPLGEMQVIGRPGADRTLQNWDTIRFRAGGKTYTLRLGYDGTTITAGDFLAVG